LLLLPEKRSSVLRIPSLNERSERKEEEVCCQSMVRGERREGGCSFEKRRKRGRREKEEKREREKRKIQTHHSTLKNTHIHLLPNSNASIKKTPLSISEIVCKCELNFKLHVNLKIRSIAMAK